MSRGSTKIIIVGGGFGGLNAAKRLARKDHSLEITLVDKHNYHNFQPLLYQVATGGLNPGEIAVPLRTEFSKYHNVNVLLGEVTDVNLEKRLVYSDAGVFYYDYLILACGAQHSYFGHEEWEPFAPGLKTLEQAAEIRRRILLSFELAEREKDPEKIRQYLTFAIIGGGPTGVELAGTLGEIVRYTLSRDYRNISPKQTRIVLIEAGPRILPSFSEKLAKRATYDLEYLGVTVWTNSRVTDITNEGITINGNVRLNAHTVLWAAGVLPSNLNQTLGVPLDRAGRVIVEPDLSLPGHPEVFVIGDQAHVEDNGRVLPGLAPVAMQEGRYVAETILNELAGKPRRPFRWIDKGQMATIGRSRAVAETGGFEFGGILAWFTWIIVHIYYLVGFKNRVLVLIQWFWSYITFRRGAQLIINRDWESFKPRPLIPEKQAEKMTDKKAILS